jgi:hypothetical protein
MSNSQKDSDKEPTSQEAAEMLAKAKVNVNFGMLLLRHTSWWIGWRTFLLGSPYFCFRNPNISTAAVSLNPHSGTVDFWFDVEFACKLSGGDVAYIIAHESMHVVFNHLERSKKFQSIWNIVTDAFINEYLDHNLKWSPGVAASYWQEFTLKNGIRWSSLPKEIQKAFPKENIDDYSADQIYQAMIEDLSKKGIDLNQLEQQIKDMARRVGEMINKGILKGKVPGSSSQVVRKKVPLKVGDPVFIKSKGIYGTVTKITSENNDPTSEIEVSESNLSRDDFFKSLKSK